MNPACQGGCDTLYWDHCCLSTLYISDIVYKITSTICLYADDTLIYMQDHDIIHSEADVTALQSDLNTVMKWVEDWHMTFNP